MAAQDMASQTEVLGIFLFSLILIIGNAARSVAKRFHFPFTILMLVLGLLAGIAYRLWGVDLPAFHSLGFEAGKPIISPQLILLVFLPALIFESALGLDAHVFKKSLGSISLLAFPALLLAATLTACLIKFMVPEAWGWTWPLAFLFGVLISATDPVAVVALLRELGISKRLVTLIEGESLLNDGVAIVLFHVFFGMIALGATDITLSSVTLEFVRVVSGGLAVGFILALLTTFWIDKVYNDSLVEITLTLALAYLCMLIAEDVFHFSGIMAIVFAGLWMASVGKTKISPEVQHSLHDFWGMLSYIANTLIFFLVGLVMSLTVKEIHWSDVTLILGLYVGIMLIRVSVLFLFRPLISRVGETLSPAKTLVASWGGLRGAVSMALALIVSQSKTIPESWRDQVLLLSVGIVILTLIVNGTTMKALIEVLKIRDIPLGRQILPLLAHNSVVRDVSLYVEEMSSTPGYASTQWGNIKKDLDKRTRNLQANLNVLNKKLSSSDHSEQLLGYWSQVLNIEKVSYWELFEKGIIESPALNILSHEIDLQFDDLNEKRIVPPESRVPEHDFINKYIDAWLQKSPYLFTKFQSFRFNRLRLHYQLYKAVGLASTRVLERFKSIEGVDPDLAESIYRTYKFYIFKSKEHVEEMRINLPELTEALESRMTIRISLNKERERFQYLEAEGVIDSDSAERAIDDVESRILDLGGRSKEIPLPTTAELLKEVSLFKHAKEEEREKLAQSALDVVLNKGEYLFKEGDREDSLYIIVRGIAEVLKETKKGDVSLAYLSSGDILGEMALLGREPRNASILGVTSVTLIKVTSRSFYKITEDHPELLSQAWLAYDNHLLDNFARRDASLNWMTEKERKEWKSEGKSHVLSEGDSISVPKQFGRVFVVRGNIAWEDKEVTSSQMIRVSANREIMARTEARVMFLPPIVN